MSRHGLSRLTRLTGREWLDFGRSHLALIAARARLQFGSTGSLVAREVDTQNTPPEVVPERAAALARAVDRAARYGVFQPTCLVRALALQSLLRAAGLHEARIRIGVRRRDDHAVGAHAWVTYGTVVLTESNQVETEYSVFSDLRVNSA